MRKAKKPRGPRKVAYTLLTPASHPTEYKLLDKLVSEHHSELRDARIALAWCTSWRADVDGRITLGQCKRASDLDRELKPYDFVVLLQKDFWINVTVSNEQRVALVDHELCHATIKLDPYNHEPIEDERGRKVYRIRKHDLEEFNEIVERHGLYKRDLESFAQALNRAQHPEQPRLLEALTESVKKNAAPAVGNATRTH
jgi:Putative phage metallopeptidase